MVELWVGELMSKNRAVSIHLHPWISDLVLCERRTFFLR